jgi:hypothetical protein
MLSEYNYAGITPASGGHGIVKNSIARKNTTTGFSSQGVPLDGGSNNNVTLFSCYGENNGSANFNRENNVLCKMRAINCVSKLTGAGVHFSAGVDLLNCININ